jgi:hypothetical protein
VTANGDLSLTPFGDHTLRAQIEPSSTKQLYAQTLFTL